jgi:multidrug efflux pump subunit AcrB
MVSVEMMISDVKNVKNLLLVLFIVNLTFIGYCPRVFMFGHICKCSITEFSIMTTIGSVTLLFVSLI